MKKSSGQAVASMILGIISLCLSLEPVINIIAFFAGLLAVIFGTIALIRGGGTGQAVTGVTTGAAGVIFSATMITIIAVFMNIVPKMLNETSASHGVGEKQNAVHEVIYKVTSEEPVTVD